MDPEQPAPGQHDQGFTPMDQYSMDGYSQNHDLNNVHLVHQPFQNYSQQTPLPFGLLNFYQGSAGPWNQLASASKDSPNQTVEPLSNSYQPPPGTYQYRNKALASECDTSMPGAADSGYGTRSVPRSAPSVGHPERVQHDFDEGERLGNMHLDRQSGQPQTIHSNNHLAVPKPTSRARVSTGRYMCDRPGCGAAIKTKSEHTKHMHRHDKPFSCSVPKCTRGPGFSTKNDLQRHLKTVHQDLYKGEQTYYCILGDCAKKQSAKPWPRADNFRQHLHRVHNIKKKAEEDLTPFLGLPDQQLRMGSEAERRPFTEENDLSLTGIGAFESLDSYQHPEQLPMAEIMDAQSDEAPSGPQTSATGAVQWQRAHEARLATDLNDQHLKEDEEASPAPFGQTAQVTWSLLPPSRAGTLRRSPRTSGAATLRGMDDISSSIDNEPATSPSSICLDTSPAARPDIQEIVNALPSMIGTKRQASSDASAIVAALKEHIRPDILLSVARTIVDDETHDLKEDMTDPRSLFPCEDCNKSFPRQCELKKHRKRHEKPYGCTFKGCQKEFGSKNDWKRHESSQHLQLETWSCEYDGCTKICNRRESFKNHLIREHGQTRDADLEQQLERRRLGRHCDRHYWCGFCKRIQTITENGVNCWMKRCDHIDDHICGRRGMQKSIMSSWEYLEDQSRPSSPSEGVQAVSVEGPMQLNVASGGDNKTLKRKNGGLEVPRPKKQIQAQSQDGWVCCQCTDPLFSTGMNASCTGCEHRRCSNCESFCFGTTRAREQIQEAPV